MEQVGRGKGRGREEGEGEGERGGRGRRKEEGGLNTLRRRLKGTLGIFLI